MESRAAGGDLECCSEWNRYGLGKPMSISRDRFTVAVRPANVQSC